MTLDEFKAALVDAETAMDLPLGFDGCPCFRFEVEGFRAVGHCWRTWYTPDPPSLAGHCEHTYVGLHYWGDPVLAKRLSHLLTAMDWYGGWPRKREGDYAA
jgi:hypothetical protein